jgi:ElaB/YqjD/DUF883 family membrane-anchored ribosome-binding protein
MSLETDQIEADVKSSRHRLNDTLQQMGGKLSPGQILDEAMALLQGQAGEFAGNLSRQVRDNPLPAVLIGAGIGMMLLNKVQQGGVSHHGSSTYDALDEAGRLRRFHDESEDDFDARRHEAHFTALNLSQRAGETMDGFKQRVADSADAVRRAGASAGDRISATASGAMRRLSDGAHSVGKSADRLRDNAADFYDRNPFVSGVIGLTVGAILGSALPLSDTERDALEGVANRAANVSADVAERSADALSQHAQPMH